jgi:hypothetical protein
MSRTKPDTARSRRRTAPGCYRASAAARTLYRPRRRPLRPRVSVALALVPLAVEHGLVWEQGLGLVEATVGPINRRLSTSKANSGPYAVATPSPAHSRALRTRSAVGHKPGEIGMGHWGATNPRRSVRRRRSLVLPKRESAASVSRVEKVHSRGWSRIQSAHGQEDAHKADEVLAEGRLSF